MTHRFIISLTLPQITPLGFLGVLVGLIFVRTTKESLFSVPNGVCSWDIVLCTRKSNVSMYPLDEFISLVMLSLKRFFFPFALLHPNAGAQLRKDIILLDSS
jgi:hypothetical protein